MSPRKAAALQIAIALAFAAAMLATSAWFPENSDTVRNLMIAVWWIPFSYLSAKGGRSCVLKCGRRKAGGSEA